MPARDPEDRATVALIAALERWGREPDRTAATQPARDAHRAKFAREVDPDGVLDPAEREKRVDHLVRAHMLKMSRAAKKTRAAKATTTGGGPDAA